MKKSSCIGIILLFAFMGIMAMPLLSAPALPHSEDRQINFAYFENGDNHTSHWLIRSISEIEEFNSRTAATNDCILLFIFCINYHSNIHNVRLNQINEQANVKVPKERIYLINSQFTI